MKTMTSLFAAAVVAAAVPSAASAEDFFYTLTGPNGGYTASWQMVSMPLPDQAVADQGFAIERLTGTFPGSTFGDVYLDFFAAMNGGGLSISDADGPDLLASLGGVQLYTGPETAPTMRRGIFALTDVNGLSGYTLTVADRFGGVPEPQAWLLMIAGFGLVGGVMRVRRTTVRYA